jgi:hypothetical protein
MDLLEAIFALLRAVLKAVTEKSDDALLNRAYGCFGFLGLASLAFGLSVLLSESTSLGGGLTVLFGMLLPLALMLGMFAVSVCGIILTVKFRRHSALVLLSVVSIVCGGGGIFYISHSVLPDLPHDLEYAPTIGVAIYIAANVLIPTWWFAMGRRR